MGEGIYLEIKRRVLAGEFRLRERIDASKLAQTLETSVTPVREALIRLTVERLIEGRPHRGFFLNVWSEAELKALYQWRGALVRLAIASFEGGVQPNIAGRKSYPERVAALLQHLEAGANAELKQASSSADERLRAARVVEPDVIGDCAQELVELRNAAGVEPKRRVLVRINAYHARRLDRAADIRARVLMRAHNNVPAGRDRQSASRKDHDEE